MLLLILLLLLALLFLGMMPPEMAAPVSATATKLLFEGFAVFFAHALHFGGKFLPPVFAAGLSVCTTTTVMMMAATSSAGSAPFTKQQSAEDQQADGLQVGDEGKSKKVRHKGIPQEHDYDAEQKCSHGYFSYYSEESHVIIFLGCEL